MITARREEAMVESTARKEPVGGAGAGGAEASAVRAGIWHDGLNAGALADLSGFWTFWSGVQGRCSGCVRLWASLDSYGCAVGRCGRRWESAGWV